MTTTNSMIVYRSRTEQALDNALWDGTLAPIFAAAFAFMFTVYVLGTILGKMMRRSWVEKIPEKLRPAYFFIYWHATPFVFVISAFVAWIVFKITFSYVI